MIRRTSKDFERALAMFNVCNQVAIYQGDVNIVRFDGYAFLLV